MEVPPSPRVGSHMKTPARGGQHSVRCWSQPRQEVPTGAGWQPGREMATRGDHIKSTGIGVLLDEGYSCRVSSVVLGWSWRHWYVVRGEKPTCTTGAGCWDVCSSSPRGRRSGATLILENASRVQILCPKHHSPRKGTKTSRETADLATGARPA